MLFRSNLDWGMAGSPLVLGDKVIVNPGIDEANNARQAVAAYDRKTGKRLWASGEHKAGYSSPQLATLAGKSQILLFDAGGLAGFDPDVGTELWRHPWETFNNMNIIQPLVFGDDRVFISSELSNGCAMLRVTRQGDKFAVETVWANKQMGARYCNPVAFAGHIFGLSNGFLVCLDEATGKRVWKDGRYGNGQLVRSGSLLVVTSEAGEVALVAADPERYRELAKLRLFDASKTWNTPALAGNQLFVRNHEELACLELPAKAD